MKEIIFIISTYFIVYTWAEITVQHSKTKTCANVTRVNITVNLLDKGCMKKSSDNATELPIWDENDIEVQNVEMADYALCLLKKSSIMDENGKVNVYFDISKIVQHLYKKTEKGLGLVFIVKSVKECSNLSGVDEFTTAAKIMKCLLENQDTFLWCDQYNE